MQPQQSSRIDVADLKVQIVKKIGADRARRYFYYLNRLLSQKLCKSEFDKLCSRVLGRENVLLHNHRAVIANPTPNSPIWSNGAVPSWKSRPVIRDRKPRDRPSPLGPNGKLPENQRQVSAQRPKGTPRHSQDHTGLAVVEDGEEVEQASHLKFSRSRLIAPLGIPFCSASIGGARKALSVPSNDNMVSYFDSGGLFDTEILRKRMEQIAGGQGLGGVSMECANMLNNMLDVYLKRLIKSCVDGPIEVIQEQRPLCSISLLDFKVAMELNPQQLGEDWPLLLEKICMQTFEE
ncbi:unnamed protein product, partial [Vitis vinifera]